MEVTRLGLDIAKNLFQVHGVDAHGKVVVRKQLSRSKMLAYFAQLPVCQIGIEACGSAHYWGRELQKLGHDVRLMAVQLIKPYRTKQKNDRNDAEAICEAVSRPHMRFVPIKTVEQQAILTVHRARELLVAERTAVVNQIRGLLLEYGIAMAAGIQRLRRELPAVLSAEDGGLPMLARSVITELQARVLELDERIAGHDRQIAQVARQTEAAKRLMRVEGVGPITATAIVATVGDAKAFHHGRQFGPGGDWCPSNSVRVASRYWGGSPSAAMCICALSSFTARAPSSSSRPSEQTPRVCGWRGYASGGGTISQRWPLPRSTLGFCGRCWLGDKSIGWPSKRACLIRSRADDEL
jgi:transposase